MGLIEVYIKKYKFEDIDINIYNDDINIIYIDICEKNKEFRKYY